LIYSDETSLSMLQHSFGVAALPQCCSTLSNIYSPLFAVLQLQVSSDRRETHWEYSVAVLYRHSNLSVAVLQLLTVVRGERVLAKGIVLLRSLLSWVCRVSTLQERATHCKTREKEYSATHCNTLQHTATHCNTLQYATTHCDMLQHTAARCYTLQHTVIKCNTLQRTVLQERATHCKMREREYSATHCSIICDTLQHAATHCNTLQHTAAR